MKRFTQLLIVFLMVFALPAMAQQSHYKYANRRLSINLGYASDGFRLNYSSPHYSKYGYAKPYKYSSRYKRDKASKASRYLGYKRSSKPYLRSYNKSYPKPYYLGKRHSAYKPYYSYKQKRRYTKAYASKACHPVTKIITDAHGYYHSFRSLMCYDKFGRSYLAKHH